MSAAKESDRSADADAEAEFDIFGVTLDPRDALLALVTDDVDEPQDERVQTNEIAATKAVNFL
ncbi:hypothetical protein ACFY5F_30380 [Streptomyces sp. NPDC013161]|uniref:hypothetical protein n=1 Tax=Streptomyces sp. NPDC013161 TaxID=3364862 RepID=UPI00368DC44F